MALVRIKLADSDRARYEGLPEWLEFDLFRPMLSQVRLLKEQTGMTWAELQERAVADELEALGAVFWLAVRRAGHDVSWVDFDADLGGVEWGGEDDNDPNSSAPDGAKPTSTRSRRASSATTASSRGKSPDSRAPSSKR